MQRRRFSDSLEAAIADMIDQGKEAPEIMATIGRRADLAGEARPTSLRTIERRIRDRSSAGEPVWTFDPETAEVDDSAALAILADLVRWSAGRRTTLSKAEAATVIGIWRVAPDLQLRSIYRLARYYLSRRQSGLPTVDLDIWLGFGPWRDAASKAAYESAVASGVPRAPVDRSEDDALDNATVRAVWKRLYPEKEVLGEHDGSEVDPAVADRFEEIILANMAP